MVLHKEQNKQTKMETHSETEQIDGCQRGGELGAGWKGEGIKR